MKLSSEAGRDGGPALRGIRIVDLSRGLGGSYLSQLLADFGAEVIKLEPVGGDPLRRRPDAFVAVNRGKLSIELDVEKPANREALLALIDDADVLIECFGPATMDRLELSHERLAERNPALIHVSLTPYGGESPRSSRSAQDLNVLAVSGLLDLSGELDGPPVQPAAQIAELGGALCAAFGALTALLERERSGQGQRVDASMLDGALSFLGPIAARFFRTERVLERGEEPLRGGLTCYMPYPCKDGWLALAALEERHWKALCEGLGREDLIPHHLDRSDGWAQGQLEHIFLRRTREEWAEFAAEYDCCLDPVLHLDEALRGSIEARVPVADVVGPDSERSRVVGTPVKLSRTPAEPGGKCVPRPGEHSIRQLESRG